MNSIKRPTLFPKNEPNERSNVSWVYTKTHWRILKKGVCALGVVYGAMISSLRVHEVHQQKI